MVEGPVPSGHYLWYRGNDSVGLYDLNWNKVRDLAVRKQNFIFPAGLLSLQLTQGKGKPRPWLEMQFFTKGSL